MTSSEITVVTETSPVRRLSAIVAPRGLGLLLTITLLELFIGGGGRLLDIGPASARMYLFAACAASLAWSVVVVKPRDDHARVAWFLVLAYALIHGFAFLTGLLAGNDIEVMSSELQQSAYWLIAPFFSMSLQTRHSVRNVVTLLRWSALTLATAYLLVVVAVTTGFFNVVSLYEFVQDSSEFSIRNEDLFFYKGFLYVGIGLIFFVAQRGARWQVFSFLCAFALLLALTRGFILSTSIAVLFLLVRQRRWSSLAVAFSAVAAAAFFTWIYLPLVDDRVGDQREMSNEQRVDDMRFVLDHTSAKTLLIGEGFGTPIGERVGIENTFLWAFWRMGIFGLVFWLTPLFLCLIYFSRIPRADVDYPVACAFLFASFLVYLQTATNPYLNNPIGLSFVILGVFSLATIAKASRQAVQGRRKNSRSRSGLAVRPVSGSGSRGVTA